MGLFNLRWVCPALLLVPSLALGQVGTTVATEVAAGTTTYRVLPNTVATPSGVALSTARDITPVQPQVTRHAGGLAQSFRGQLIVAQEVSAPVSGRFNVSSAGVRQAAKVAMRNPVVIVGLLAGSALGLQGLLDTADWSVEGDTIVRPDGSTGDPSDPDSWGSAPEGVTYVYRGDTYSDLSSAATAAVDRECSTRPVPISCSLVGVEDNVGSSGCLANLTNNCSIRPLARRVDNNNPIVVVGTVTVSNPSGEIDCGTGVYSPEFYGCLSGGDFVPVTESELDDLIDQSYDPDPTDWPVVFPNMWPDSVHIDPIPSVQLEPETTTVTDNQTGTTTVTETTTELDFSVTENDTVQPEINLTETETTNTYENGTQTGSGTTTTVRPARPPAAMPSPPETGTGDGGSGFALPSFCSWASAVCDWFDWTQEPIDDDPDLPGIVSDLDDLERTKDISFGSKTCPAPIALDIDFLDMTVDLSFEWFCELAAIIYFMVMASAYVMAAYITLGVVRG